METTAIPTSKSQRRALFGAVRKSQWWVKEDDGKVMQVRCRNRDSCWTVYFPGKGRGNQSHVLKEADIYKFYRPLRS